ncbi:MAG: UvrD-helicase domain-containing protein [Anaerolineae bacterium]
MEINRNRLTDGQRASVEWPVAQADHRALIGPAGTGKTTVLVHRIAYLLEQRVPGYSVLVLVPDRRTRERFRELLSQVVREPHSDVELFTYFSLARRFVTLFWPLVARDVGFQHPERPPAFITFELAQYLMHRIVEPRLDAGFFEGLAMRPAHLVSQLLDNLNRAAVNGFHYSQIGERLKGGWPGDVDHLVYFDQAQACADAFRAECLERGVLDISLTTEVFHQQLICNPQFWRYFTERYRHLVVDNVEELVPTAHELIGKLIPVTDSTLLAQDEGGGYRYLLGTDVQGAQQLVAASDQQMHLACTEPGRSDGSFTSSPPMLELGRVVAGYLDITSGRPRVRDEALPPLHLIGRPYRSQMIEAVAEEISRLAREGTALDGIAVIAPYVDGVLRFTLREALAHEGLATRVVRRYQLLRDEAVVRAALTLAALAHPEWDIQPAAFDVTESLHLLIDDLDFIRARLLVRQLYDEGWGALRPTDEIDADTAARTGEGPLARYTQIQAWLAAYREHTEHEPLDHFLRRLFEMVMRGPYRPSSLPPGSADVLARLVASARHFRQAAPAIGVEPPLGRHYWEMVQQGVVSAQYLIEETVENAVLLAPIHTYLLSGHHARYQFWIDAGSVDWWRPPHQVLSNPFVLSHRWPAGDTWTEAIDYQTRNDILSRIVRGLCHRCRDGVFICTSDMESSGSPQESSPLLRVMTRIQVRRARTEEER